MALITGKHHKKKKASIILQPLRVRVDFSIHKNKRFESDASPVWITLTCTITENPPARNEQEDNFCEKYVYIFFPNKTVLQIPSI